MDTELGRQLNKLQAYDRGIKRIVSHEEYKAMPYFCTDCDNTATLDGLCDACNYHKPFAASKKKRKPKPPTSPLNRVLRFLDDLAIYITELFS